MFRLKILALCCGFFCLPITALAGGGNAVCEEPNVMVLLDYSGSMRDNGKWTTAVSAVNQLTNIFGSTMRIGLTLFPFGGDCSVNGSNTVFPCQINSLCPSAVFFQPVPRWGTPMGPGLNKSNNTTTISTTRTDIALLFWSPTENQLAAQIAVTLGMLRALFNNEIPVFVIGFGRGNAMQQQYCGCGRYTDVFVRHGWSRVVRTTRSSL